MSSVLRLPEGPGRRAATATSNFGVSRRESHDASAFYARFTPPALDIGGEPRAHAARDTIWCGDARDMDRHGRVNDDSVALVVTSPPYFAGKEYEQALGQGHVPASYGDFLAMLAAVFAECRRKLEPGGRIAVNVANLGRKPYRSLAADVIALLEDLGLLLRGEIIWRKQQAAGGSCAWGTYQRPANPVLRDVTERVIVASKGRFDRALSAEDRCRGGWPHEGSISMDDFVDATTDLWEIPAESATKVGHPAPFPVELPRRLIDLYTYRGDLVLDPFMGAGSTAVAAVRTERFYAGFDTDAGYVGRADERVAEERRRLADAQTGPGSGSGASRAGPPSHRVVVAPTRRLPSHDPSTAQDGNHGPASQWPADEGPAGDVVGAALRRGRKARDLALVLLEAAGFSAAEADVRFPGLGVEVSFRARDARGGVWLFDLAGAFSTTRPGLRRADVLWKCLGRAAVLHQARSDPGLGPLVLLSTDLPVPRSAADRALAAVLDEDGGGPVRAVVALLAPDALDRLARLARPGR